MTLDEFLNKLGALPPSLLDKKVEVYHLYGGKRIAFGEQEEIGIMIKDDDTTFYVNVKVK